MNPKSEKRLAIINCEDEEDEEEFESTTDLSLDQLLIDRQVKIDNAPLSVLLGTIQFRYIFSMNILSIFMGVFIVSSSKSYGI